MANPQVSFRLTKYQLAKGLKILRTIEPNHIPTSLSQLVKTLYIDYLAKTSLNHTDVVSEADIAEIRNLLDNKSKTMSFNDFQIATGTAEAISTKQKASEQKPASLNVINKEQADDESEINSLSDFSPPKDWNL